MRPRGRIRIYQHGCLYRPGPQTGRSSQPIRPPARSTGCRSRCTNIMFIARFNLKTSIQKLLFTLQDFRDFPRLHPAREMKRLALRESVRYARKHMQNSVGVESAREVLSLALKQVAVPGHYLEFGVYKGGTIRFIAGHVGASQLVHGFDSFEGLNEAWSGDPSRFDAQGRLPKVPSNVRLHKGYFADTLPGWAEGHP